MREMRYSLKHIHDHVCPTRGRGHNIKAVVLLHSYSVLGMRESEAVTCGIRNQIYNGSGAHRMMATYD